MPHSRAKIRDILTALLLAVAVSLIWPSMGNPHDHPAHSASHHLMAVDSHGTGHAHVNDERLPFCSTDLGCCVMTHCHPGVAQPPQEMPHASPYPGHERFPPTDQASFDPTILVPPPRPLLV